MHVNARLYQETHHILFAVGDTLLHLFARESERVGHLKTCVGVVLEVLYLRTLCLELLWSVKSDVCLAAVKQFLHIFFIYVAALALTVGSMLSAERHTFVKCYAEPLKRLYDIVFGSRHKAIGVCVFNAEHEVAAVLTREKIVIQCSTHSADMKRTGRTWCKTHPNSSVCHFLEK